MSATTFTSAVVGVYSRLPNERPERIEDGVIMITDDYRFIINNDRSIDDPYCDVPLEGDFIHKIRFDDAEHYVELVNITKTKTLIAWFDDEEDGASAYTAFKENYNQYAVEMMENPHIATNVIEERMNHMSAYMVERLNATIPASDDAHVMINDVTDKLNKISLGMDSINNALIERASYLNNVVVAVDTKITKVNQRIDALEQQAMLARNAMDVLTGKATVVRNTPTAEGREMAGSCAIL